MTIVGPEVVLRRQAILAHTNADAAAPDRVASPDGEPDAGPTPVRPVAPAGPPSRTAPPARPLSRTGLDLSPATVHSGDLPSTGRGWVERLREDRRREAPAPARAESRDGTGHARLNAEARQALTLVAAAAEHPVPLTGDDGLLTALVGDVLRRGLEVELEAHLGHGRWASGARGADNIRNGAYSKRVATDLGVVPVQMPRDRRGTFDPVIVPKHGRRLPTPGSSLLTIYANGASRSEMRSQLTALTQGRLERPTLEALLDDLLPDVRAWQLRRLPHSVPVLLLDTVMLSGRGSRTVRRLLDVAVAVDVYGAFELLGLWRRPGRSDAAHWDGVFAELFERGIETVEFLCAGRGMSVAPAAEAVWPGAKVRAGIASLTENSLRAFD